MTARDLDAPPWLGQPRGLTVLFLTNMWEQFSYFGMRGLLVYYMTKQLLIAQGTASLIYGTYTACAYFTPIVGGVIADRLLGKRRAIIIGASVMAAGHFMMGFEDLLYVALAVIALACSCRHCPARSTTSMPRATPGAAGPTTSTIWASTSAGSWPRCCAGRWARCSAGTSASRWRAWACWRAC
jgi:MFS family permease